MAWISETCNFYSLLQLEIQKHPFFESLSWTDLLQKKIPPPFNPNVVGAALVPSCQISACAGSSIWKEYECIRVNGNLLVLTALLSSDTSEQ